MTLMSLPTLKSLTSQIALKRHLCFTHKWRFIFYHTPYILLFIKFVESLKRGREFLSPFGQTIAARTIAGGGGEKSADFWGALQVVGIVVIKNNRPL
jgi:hypothetical protein